MTRSAGFSHARSAKGLLCLLLALVVLAGPAASAALAQPEEEGAAEQKEPPSTGDDTASESGSKGPLGTIVHIVKSLGWFWAGIFLAVSICMISIVVLLAMDLRFGEAIPPGFVEDFSDTVNKRQFKAAYELARGDGSILGRALTSGMSRLQYGVEDARESAFNMVGSIRASKEQLIAYLAVIGTVGPLLGLIGTVWGMIEAFSTLAQAKQDPRKLGANIGVALSTTIVGVLIATMAIFFHTFFRNRLTRITTDTENVVDDLLTQMYHNSKKPAPAAAAAAVPAAVPAPAATVVPEPDGSTAPAAFKPK